jgi:hypothetical protein
MCKNFENYEENFNPFCDIELNPLVSSINSERNTRNISSFDTGDFIFVDTPGSNINDLKTYLEEFIKGVYEGQSLEKKNDSNIEKNKIPPPSLLIYVTTGIFSKNEEKINEEEINEEEKINEEGKINDQLENIDRIFFTY